MITFGIKTITRLFCMFSDMTGTQKTHWTTGYKQHLMQ